MKLDFRWLAVSCAELALMAAALVFADAHSWSSSASTWTLITLLVLSMLANHGIERWFEQAPRRRGAHR